MAGVAGRCPHCSTLIAAPQKAATPQVPTADDQSRIRPEPRSLPERRTGGIAPRHSTDDNERRQPLTVEQRTRHGRNRRVHRRHGSLLTRFVIPTLFSAAGVAVVFLLLNHFYPNNPAKKPEAGKPPTTEAGPLATPNPDQPSDGTAAVTPPPLGTGPDPASEELVSPTFSATDGINAGKVLDRFISATNLNARLNLIDPPLTVEEIKGTVAGKRMPEVTSLASANPDYDSLENIANFPFRVTFRGGEGTTAEYLILVRKRGDAQAKVAINPFLDLVGGRLEAFTSEPVKGPKTFHTIIEALPRCFEEDIPNGEKKITYKLLPCDVGRETARAYASVTSDLAEQLFLPESPIRFGVRLRATVVLEWNFDEDPERPFIEVIRIESFNWNS